MTEPRPALDVSHLPPLAFDMRSTAWWGNTLFMVIETTSIVLLMASYFYTRQNFPDWPPPRSDSATRPGDVLPALGVSTLGLILLVGSCLPMKWVDRAAREGDERAVRRGLLLLTALGLLSIVLRFFEFQGLKFRWDDNAYGSLVWAIPFMHLTYLTAATLEVGSTTLWIALYGMDENLADDVTLTTMYWYWMVSLWLPLYTTVYWAPRLL